jgi:hypothetical protein
MVAIPRVTDQFNDPEKVGDVFTISRSLCFPRHFSYQNQFRQTQELKYVLLVPESRWRCLSKAPTTSSAYKYTALIIETKALNMKRASEADESSEITESFLWKVVRSGLPSLRCRSTIRSDRSEL